MTESKYVKILKIKEKIDARQPISAEEATLLCDEITSLNSLLKELTEAKEMIKRKLNKKMRMPGEPRRRLRRSMIQSDST